MTLRDIADLVGMRAPSLYTHFPSKNAIYDAMFGDAWTQFLEHSKAAVVDEPRTSRAAMRFYARVFFDFAVAFPAGGQEGPGARLDRPPHRAAGATQRRPHHGRTPPTVARAGPEGGPWPAPPATAAARPNHDVILTRDPFMHRLDICAATGLDPRATAEHDGRLVDDIVQEWAQRHGQPYTLKLTGPAGGVWGGHGEKIQLDALEFCRRLSGRGDTAGLLATAVPF